MRVEEFAVRGAWPLSNAGLQRRVEEAYHRRIPAVAIICHESAMTGVSEVFELFWSGDVVKQIPSLRQRQKSPAARR